MLNPPKPSSPLNLVCNMKSLWIKDESSLRIRVGAWLLLIGCLGLGVSPHATLAQAATNSFERKPIALIPAGTKFGEKPPEDWSNLISFVNGKLTRGDVEAVTETVRYYAEIFNLVMLANASQDAAGKYVLNEVAVGFSMLIDGQNVVVTPASQAALGGDLSLIGRGVLDGNVAALAKVQQVVRTSNNMIIDAPATLLRDGKHREMVVRYYIWVFPENGNVGTLVWLLDPMKSQLQVADTTIQLLPPNMHEDRIMNVDKDEFNFLGIPSKDAFALVQIPQGTPFEMTDEMKAVAAQSTYTADSFTKLTAAIAQTLRSGQ